MRIAIVGAGAIGCLLAARLADRGHQITLVARSEQAEAIRGGGLLVRGSGGEVRRHAPRAVEWLDEWPELVLLAVKTQDVAAACAAIRPRLAGAPVVALQNGVRADRLATDALGPDAVLGGVVMCAATYLRPGEVSEQFSGWLIVGEPSGPPRPRTRAVAALLGEAVPTYLTRHLERVRWSKLIANLNNAPCAVTGRTLPELARHPAGRRVSLRLMAEGWRTARAAGLRLDHGLYGLTPRALRRDPNAALVALLQAAMSPALLRLPEPLALALIARASRGRLGGLPVRGSTWQSLARGRPSEIEYLNGEIVRLGARIGMPTPYNAHLVALVREVERTHAFRGIEALLPPSAVPAARPTMTASVP
jgi:2-dehydropantoate 2-reductase